MSDAVLGAAEFRELLEGRLNADYNVSYPYASVLSGSARQRYIYFKNRYPVLRAESDEDLPRVFEETTFGERLIASNASVELAEAVVDGNASLLSFATGLTNKDVPLQSAEATARLFAELERPGFMACLVGATNSGKTNTALYFAELCLELDEEMCLLTNMEIDLPARFDAERLRSVRSSDELLRVADECERSVAVLDEMSIEANAQTNNYEVNDRLYPAVTHKSKLDMRLFAIGHREDGRDIAPALRQHADYMILQKRDYESDEYVAEHYTEYDDGELLDLSHAVAVPESSIGYDPDEPAPFDL